MKFDKEEKKYYHLIPMDFEKCSMKELLEVAVF